MGPDATGGAPRGVSLRTVGWAVLLAALPALGVALGLDARAVGNALDQDWPPFVLVTGLLALGLVARDDGLFDAAGTLMADAARGGRSLYVGSAVLVALVTAVLNLDTAVAFLTPVLVVAARRRDMDEAPFLYLSVFLVNGASSLLPGSNLTNLIVLGGVHESGGAFFSVMVLPWVASTVAVSAMVAIVWHRALRRSAPRLGERPEWHPLPGLLGIGVVVGAMLALAPAVEALVALVVGAAAAAWNVRSGRSRFDDVRQTVNLPLLAGLFALALDSGTLGRVWSGPAHLLAHASTAVTAVVGAVASVAVNNLPAASLLAARPPGHPHALLIGLDLGPNLAVTGALSAVLWLQVARNIGARPSVARYSAAGLLIVPVSMALALLALR